MIYCLGLTCAHCGAEVTHANGTSNQSDQRPGSHVTGVVDCTTCGRSWMVDVVLRPLGAGAKVKAS